MSKLSIPEIRKRIGQCTSGLRLMFDLDNPEHANALLILSEIDELVDQARRAPNKPKVLTKERIEAPLGKAKS